MNTSCKRPVRNNPSRLQTSLWFLLGIALLSPSSIAESSDCLWADGEDANLTLVYEVVPAELPARGLQRERMATDAGERKRQRRALLAQAQKARSPCLVPLASTQSTNVSLAEGSSATLPCFVLLRADHMVRMLRYSRSSPSAPPAPSPNVPHTLCASCTKRTARRSPGGVTLIVTRCSPGATPSSRTTASGLRREPRPLYHTLSLLIRHPHPHPHPHPHLHRTREYLACSCVPSTTGAS